MAEKEINILDSCHVAILMMVTAAKTTILAQGCPEDQAIEEMATWIDLVYSDLHDRNGT